MENMEYELCPVSQKDSVKWEMMCRLLEEEGITRDAHLDYSVGLFDEDGQIAATGSYFANTLRCMAVSHLHQGENLMAQIVTHLVEKEAEKGVTHLFLFTKCSTAVFFRELGFYEIARVPGKLVFMENERNGFEKYLQKLKKSFPPCAGGYSSIVMNANPFTLGHSFLARKAAGESRRVIIFVVSGGTSLIPFHDRLAMVRAGCADYGNVTVVPGGDYIISSATFPSYFIREPKEVTAVHASLDSILFAKIAASIGITKRYAGDEPFSAATEIYNNALMNILPDSGVQVEITPRLALHNVPVSASHVRQLIHDGKLEEIRELVPETTYSYIAGNEGRQIISRIQSAEDVIHH